MKLSGAIVLLLPLSALAADRYLFAFFRDNGQHGINFAISSDGYHWTELNDGKPLVKPMKDTLTRDPYLVRGPDKLWHMIWTTDWQRSKTDHTLTIGYASSKDLKTWSEPRAIPINLPQMANAWAPELVWDQKQKKWIVFWASAPDRKTHRIYSMTTADFKTFSEPAIFFDPGVSVIDSTVVQDGKRWVMVWKDERESPLQKRLRLAFADSPAGPWKDVTEPFSRDWIEGPSAIKIGLDWLIYFDHYRQPLYYGAYRTRDWKQFEEVSEKMTFPKGHKHGSVVSITDRELRFLSPNRSQ